VLIQWRRGGPKPTDACWQFAANLAGFYSDAHMERNPEVTAAEVKQERNKIAGNMEEAS
jgi:predicted TIM-barrel enzyme